MKSKLETKVKASNKRPMALAQYLYC